MNTVKNSILKNFIWRFAERCGAQLVTFIVSIVLARILAPEDYGTIALVTVFTTILQVFVDSGLGTALIQKKDADTAVLQEQLPVLSLQALADAPACLRQCRHAVRAGRVLNDLSAALLVLLAGLAGGVFSPALDFGDRPLLCALLSLLITAVSVLLACIAVPSAPARHPEEEPPQPAQPQPEAVSAEASTTALRMDELPAVPGKIALEQALLDVPGVLTAEANYETGIILVTGTADKETLLRAIAEAASVKEGKQ